MIILYYILVMFFLLSLAFFCAAETAIMSANKILIKSYADRKIFGARKALKILERTEVAIGMTLIGTNISHISATSIITYIVSVKFHLNAETIIIISLAQTIMFLLFCELFPKIFARAKSASFLCYSSFAISFLIKLFFPFIQAFLVLSRAIKIVFRIKEGQIDHIKSRDEINLIFMLGEKSGVIGEDYKAYVDEVLEMNQVIVKEVMTPTIDIISVEDSSSVKSVIGLINQTHYSRIPVYSERVDNITGYVYYKDLFDKTKESISDIVRTPYYVPETKLVYELYREMHDENIYVAFAVNEHGAITGLASREDVAEEIFGEIQTRDHKTKELIKETGKNRFSVSGSLDIDIFEKYFSVEIDKKHFDTVAGFVMSHTGRIPAKGEKFLYSGLKISIENSDPRSVKSITVKKAD